MIGFPATISAMKSREFEASAVTASARDIVDITDDVERLVAACGIRDGHVTISVQSPGCALFVNEKESGLFADIRTALERLDSPEAAVPAIGSGSVVVPADAGRLSLGTWQRILLLELDRPAERTITVRMEGE